MNITEQQIIEVLKQVKHPEKNEDIVSMGMVKNIRIEQEHAVFTLVSRKMRDPLIQSIRRACFQALEQQFGKELRFAIEVEEPVRKMEPGKFDSLKDVKNIIAVASGKGGVGKSTVATNLAVALANTGARVGLVDADIFGPSIPKMFDLMDARPVAHQVEGKDLIVPVDNYGVKILSIGFFIRPEDATVWRGPMASNFLKQIFQQGDWGALDYLLVDLPPGTSDIHLTLVQEVDVTGAIIVSTPQDVALADAVKGISMFRNEKINVPVLGLVENMAWFTPAELPENRYYIFGKDGCKELAKKMQVRLLGQIPIVQAIREGGDKGIPSALIPDSPEGKAFTELAREVILAVEERNKNLPPTRRVIVNN